MGKLLGFLETERELPKDRPEMERVTDFESIHLPWPMECQRRQAARCMECAAPFCHSGMLLGGTPAGCPLGNLIPEWNDLLYHGRLAEAAMRLQRTNPFPEFTSRVCPALCEGACACGVHGQPVTVRQNEYAIMEYAFREGLVYPRTPQAATGKRVAVVGSGPAGLACAQQLYELGHRVTVLERADRIGGLLMYGIPNMKLEKNVVERRIELMRREGIDFHTLCEVGTDFEPPKLKSDFDAAVLCCGAGKARKLNAQGAEGSGVVPAVVYLTAATRNLLAGMETPPQMNARNKHVLVVGGGDTGTDCVGTALRQGCLSVRQLEIMPKLSPERAANNPWPEYPRVLKTDYAQQEAIAKFGKDPRDYLTTVESVLRSADGRVCGVSTVQVEWTVRDGRRVPVPAEGTRQVRPAELVLVAMGFEGPEDALPDALGLQRDARSNVLTSEHQTSLPGVFAAGDMRTGQSLVVRAIADGLEAATACDRYLQTKNDK